MKHAHKGITYQVKESFGNTFYATIGSDTVLHPGDWRNIGYENAVGYETEQAANQAAISKINQLDSVGALWTLNA